MERKMYALYGLNLTEQQAKKLKSGKQVRLKPENLQGEHPLYLTDAQIKKIQSSLRRNKGMMLKLSEDQLKHHKISGGSIFDTLKSAWKFASDAGLVDAGKDIIKEQIVPRLVARGKKSIENLVDKGLKKVGAGVTSADTHGSVKSVHHDVVSGDGFWGDFADGFKKGFTGVARIAAPIAGLIPATRGVAPILGAIGEMGGSGVKKGRKGRKGKAKKATDDSPVIKRDAKGKFLKRSDTGSGLAPPGY